MTAKIVTVKDDRGAVRILIALVRLERPSKDIAVYDPHGEILQEIIDVCLDAGFIVFIKTQPDKNPVCRIDQSVLFM